MKTLGLYAAFAMFAMQVLAQGSFDPNLERINISEHLGNTVTSDLAFTDQDGHAVSFGDYFDGERPVVLILAYYECPMLCTQVLNGLSSALDEAKWKPGDSYRVLTVSIDPEENATMAKAKQQTYVAAVKDGGFHQDWQFWTGKDEAIKSLAEQIGFQYFYDEKRDEYAHPAAVYILSPERKISRYLYGISYPASHLEMALGDASEGKIGSTIDRIIWRCFHYDSTTGAYTMIAFRTMRIGGALTLILMGVPLFILWRREATRKRSTHPRGAQPAKLAS